MLETDLRLN